MRLFFVSMHIKKDNLSFLRKIYSTGNKSLDSVTKLQKKNPSTLTSSQSSVSRASTSISSERSKD